MKYRQTYSRASYPAHVSTLYSVSRLTNCVCPLMGPVWVIYDRYSVEKDVDNPPPQQTNSIIFRL